MTGLEKRKSTKCFLCNRKIDSDAKRYSQKQAIVAFEARLQKPSMFFSSISDYAACKSCAAKLDRHFHPASTKSEDSLGQIFGGLAMMAIFGFLTWLQVGRIAKESYWIIFRIWFIPIPVILLTGLATLVGGLLLLQGIALLLQGIASKLKSLFRR